MTKGTCPTKGCEKPVKRAGLCDACYCREWRRRRAASLPPKPPRVAHRKYPLKADYFEQIDTPEKAYWLGFLTADGSVARTNVSLELANIDAGHIAKFARAIESEAPISPTRQNCVRARFHSTRLAASLASLGLIQRKSLVVVPPLEKLAGLEPYYWRGLWDGDGTISVRRDRAAGWLVGIVGSAACVDGFATWARGVSGSRALPNNKTCRNRATWQWTVIGTRKPQLLAEQLKRAGMPFGLDRKQASLEEVCAFDLDRHEARWKADRAILMREVWASGRHPRAKRTA